MYKQSPHHPKAQPAGVLGRFFRKARHGRVLCLFLVACARAGEWLDWLYAQKTNEGLLKADG